MKKETLLLLAQLIQEELQQNEPPKLKPKEIISNSELLGHIQTLFDSASQYKDSLIAINHLVEKHQFNREEIAQHIMQNQNCDRATAMEFYSRMRKLISYNNLEDLKESEVTVSFHPRSKIKKY